MILVDTSVWVDHLRRGDAALSTVLEAGDVACHPIVIGEIACGRLRQRRELLSLLGALPSVEVASHEEALAFMESRVLDGRGVGWIDVHLLASAALSRVALWTRDRRLGEAAHRLGCAYALP